MSPVVTISASYGAGGSWVGPQVAERLGCRFVDRAIPVQVAERLAVPVEHDPQREQRVRGAALDRHEHREQDRTDYKRSKRHDVRPPAWLGLREAVDEGEQSRRHGNSPRHVQLRALGGNLVGQQDERRGNRGHRQNDVHIQAPAP